jgi:hypothetical protein
MTSPKAMSEERANRLAGETVILAVCNVAEGSREERAVAWQAKVK